MLVARLAAILVLMSPARARGDDAEVGPRTLGGHTFVPSTLVDWPFIVSRIASTTSAGFVEIELGSQPLARRFELEGTDDFVYAEQTIVGGGAITQWLFLGIRAQATLVAPLDRAGAVLLGGHALYGATGIAALRVIRTHRFQVTVLVDGGRLRRTSIVPARLPRSPLQEGDLNTIRPALALALAVSPRIGIQASASYAWQQLDDGDGDTFGTVTGGGAVTLDLRPVPLEVLVAAQYANELGDDATDAASTFLGAGESRVWGEVGVVYRGVRQLDVGAAFDLRLTDLSDETRWFGQVRIAYYFE